MNHKILSNLVTKFLPSLFTFPPLLHIPLLSFKFMTLFYFNCYCICICICICFYFTRIDFLGWRDGSEGTSTFLSESLGLVFSTHIVALNYL